MATAFHHQPHHLWLHPHRLINDIVVHMAAKYHARSHMSRYCINDTCPYGCQMTVILLMDFHIAAKYVLAVTYHPHRLINDASSKISQGYADLKNNRLTDYTFNFDQMLNDKGDTAVYLLYAHARICSIIRKSGKDVEDLKKTGTLVLAHPHERMLGLHLLRFAEEVEEACTYLFPSVLCKYLYNLSEYFTKFYSNCQVVGSAEEMSRLLLCEATATVMRKCFDLLGIMPVYKI